jgi:hypothetical protein
VSTRAGQLQLQTLQAPQPGAPAGWEIGAMLVLSVAGPVDGHGTYEVVISGAGSPMSVPFRVAPPS